MENEYFFEIHCLDISGFLAKTLDKTYLFSLEKVYYDGSGYDYIDEFETQHLVELWLKNNKENTKEIRYILDDDLFTKDD